VCATAASHLAVAYLRGLGVKEDPMSGRRWLHHATEMQDASAIYNLALLHLCRRLHTPETRHERDELRSLLRNLSSSLDPEHVYLTGLCHDFGLGIDSDKRLALSEYEKAAHWGHSHARFRLGVIHETVAGAPFLADKTAAYWYRLAARGGNLAAQNNLGLLNNAQKYVDAAHTLHSQKEPEEDWLALAAEHDDLAAMNQAFEVLGGLRSKGGISPSVDQCAQLIGKAYPMLTKASNSKLPIAQLYLALILEVGIGVPRDLKQAHSL
jgi:TPR repeat protein